MKELKTSQLCIEWELLNKTKNPITNRKIKKNGPTYKLLEDVCKNTQVFFAQKKKPQEFNKIKNFDLFQTKDIECKKQCTRADAETQTRASDFGPPNPVQESTSDPYFSALSEVKENSVLSSYVTNYKNLKTRIQEANNVCAYLNKTVTIADQQWCVSGPDKQIFNTYIDSFNILANGTFGIVSRVYFKNLDTPVIIKESKFSEQDDEIITVKTIEGRFKLQKNGKKNYFSLENVILEAIDRLILQPHRSPNFLLFYETTWCQNCNMVVKGRTFEPGSCYLTFIESADTDLYSIELPSIYQQESVLYQILLGLHSLQKYLGLWHRDIKTDNIFIKRIQPGGVFKYNVDNETYYVQNTGYVAYVSDFNVCDCLKRDVLSEEYYKFVPYNCLAQPIQVKYINNQPVGVPLKNTFNKKLQTQNMKSGWMNSKNQTVDLIPNPIPIIEMHKDPMQFPFYKFFGDIQDVIRMFTGGKRAEISLLQVTVKPELDEMYTRLMNAGAYAKKLPHITTKCVKYLLAKEMLKTVYRPPPKDSGKIYIIEEFTL